MPSALGRTERIIGLPGDGALQHQCFPANTKVLVCRDGDPEGSPADKAIIAGLDALLVQKLTVDVVPRPGKKDDNGNWIKEDANSIWQEDGGREALAGLLDSAFPAELSIPWGIVKYAAALPPDQLESERATLAKTTKWQTRKEEH